MSANAIEQVKIWSRAVYIFWMAYPVVLVIGQIYLFLILWQFSDTPESSIKLSEDTRLFLIVALAGGFGSTIRLLRAIPNDYRDFNEKGTTEEAKAAYKRVIPFYVLRPFLGPPVAIIVYLALRGGLFSANTTEQINPFGIAAVAGLTGLFSDSAIDKLKQVFDTFMSVESKS